MESKKESWFDKISNHSKIVKMDIKCGYKRGVIGVDIENISDIEIKNDFEIKLNGLKSKSNNSNNKGTKLTVKGWEVLFEQHKALIQEVEDYIKRQES